MKDVAAAIAASLAMFASLAGAQDRPQQTAQDQRPINTMCPIGKEPIVPSAGTVVHDGKTIGLCCPGCGEQFLGWDEDRKDRFVALALAGREPGVQQGQGEGRPTAGQDQADQQQADQDQADQDRAEQAWSEPYPLGVCPISGQPLGSMGEPIVARYDGREVRFCCAACVEAFEADRPAAWRKIDRAIIEDQKPYYPLNTCVVSGEPLVEDGKDVGVDVVVGNRLVRLCCQACREVFEADPRRYVAILDQAAAKAQRERYPLTTCIVAGGRLGSMGEPTELVLAGRLLRFCCASCEPKALAQPAAFIEKIDKAWRDKGMFMPGTTGPADASDAADHEHGGRGPRSHGDR
ncbi:MAG: hypothetical protein KatS3mg103_1373 [Phycisphaerales bacterium]|nr:MAG: hypothetical protein KatS3mg103_1373 [Phycisphaerales bacterium]